MNRILARIREDTHLRTAIDVIVTIAGLCVLLLIGYVPSPTSRAFVEAIGTSLVAAGLIAILMRLVHREEQREVIKVIAEDRNALNSEYHDRKYFARETDVMSVALSAALNELVNDSEDRLLRRVINDGAQVRLMLLAPSAPYTQQRADEDDVPHEELCTVLRHSIDQCKRVHDKLVRLHDDTGAQPRARRHPRGLFEIRMLQMCPHFTIYRTDDQILWGLYTSAHRGQFSPVLEVVRSRTLVFEHLVGHFERLWNLSRRHWLVRYHDTYKPTLNDELYAIECPPEPRPRDLPA